MVHQIGHYNYENIDLQQKAAWLSNAKGPSGDPLPDKLERLSTSFLNSSIMLVGSTGRLRVEWRGEASDAAAASIDRASRRNYNAQDASDRGHASVTDYGVSFDEMRRKVHYEDPNVAWQPAPTPGAPVPGDPFSVQTDQFDPMQKHRTADAAANAALRAHEQRTRELVAAFPTVDSAPTSPAAAGGPAPGGIGLSTATGGGAGTGPGGGAGGWSGGPAAAPPPALGGSPGGPPGGGSTHAPAAAGGAGVPGGPVGGGPPGSSSAPQGLPGPGGGGQGPGSAPVPGGNAAGGSVVPAPIPGGGPGQSSVRGTPPWLSSRPGSPVPGLGNSGVIGGGRSPSVFAPGGPSEGRQFSSRLPVIAEPMVPGGGGAAGRSSSTMYPPMMGMGAGGSSSSTRRTKYWVPSSEAFDVELPPHVDGVIRPDPEDPR